MSVCVYLCVRESVCVCVCVCVCECECVCVCTRVCDLSSFLYTPQMTDSVMQMAAISSERTETLLSLQDTLEKTTQSSESEPNLTSASNLEPQTLHNTALVLRHTAVFM